MRGYAICTAARSGSNYLSQLLGSTGQLGHAEEYFNAAGRRKNGYADYPDDREAQLAAIFELGATANGVYGLKVFADQVDAIAGLRWTERLPNLSFVHLERRDLLGQAISLTRARQTLQFRSTQTPKGEPAYDGTAINNVLIGLIRDNARWRFWFAKNGIPVLRLLYEDVVANPAGAVKAVAELIGLSGHLTIEMAQVKVEVQRDGLNDAWRTRFLAESRDLNVFN